MKQGGGEWGTEHELRLQDPGPCLGRILFTLWASVSPSVEWGSGEGLTDQITKAKSTLALCNSLSLQVEA